jgi:hypothetical protein
VNSVCPELAFEFRLTPYAGGALTRSDEICQASISKRRITIEANEPFFQANQFHFSLGLRIIAVLLVLPLAAKDIGPREVRFTLAIGDDATGADVGFCAKGDCVLIPDPEFVFTKGYLDFRAHVLASWIPWNHRRRCVFWRGSTTGLLQGSAYPSSGPEWYKALRRTEMCTRLRKPPYSSFCDVGISNIVQITDPVLVTNIEKELMGTFVHRANQMQYGFLIDIDGNTNSWPGLMQALILGGCVIKVESPYRQWYYGDLKPEGNMVSVKADLSDLEDTVSEAVRRPRRAKRIAANGYALAANISFEGAIIGAARNLLDRFK